MVNAMYLTLYNIRVVVIFIKVPSDHQRSGVRFY